MSNLDRDVQLLLTDAEKVAREVERLYQKQLAGTDIQDALALAMKRYLEDLRSVLDYLASDRFEHSGHW